LNAGRNKFIPKYIPIGKLKDQQLSDYTAVTLINCPGTAFNDALWFQLGTYVENGGGLIVVLGATDKQIHPVYYNRAQAQFFLAGGLEYWKPRNAQND